MELVLTVLVVVFVLAIFLNFVVIGLVILFWGRLENGLGVVAWLAFFFLELGIAGLWTRSIGLAIAGFVITLGFVGFLYSGFLRITEQQRAVIEKWGAYYTILMPGWHWIFPWVMKVRAVANLWQQKVPLFPGDETAIDVKDGTLTPKGAEAIVQIKFPDTLYDAEDGNLRTGVYRSIYAYDDWHEAITDLLENAVRSFLNGITVDEATTERVAGFDLSGRISQKELDAVNKRLNELGFELLRITVRDFGLDDETVKARTAIQVQQRRAEAAKFEAQMRASETIGSLIEMMAQAMGVPLDKVRGTIQESEELRKEVLAFSKTLVSQKLSADAGSLTDIRVSGGGDLQQSLLQLIAALRAGGGRNVPS